MKRPMAGLGLQRALESELVVGRIIGAVAQAGLTGDQETGLVPAAWGAIKHLFAQLSCLLTSTLQRKLGKDFRRWTYQIQGGVVALLLATQTCISLAPGIKQGVRVLEFQTFVRHGGPFPIKEPAANITHLPQAHLDLFRELCHPPGAPGISEQEPQHLGSLGGKQALELTAYRDRLPSCNPLSEYPIKDQSGIALLVHKGDLVFLAEGLACRGEEGSDQQWDGARAIPADRVDELPEGQTHVTGLTIGQHSTGKGLLAVFQLKPNQRIDAAVNPVQGQNRLHATDHGDLGQQLQEQPQGRGLFVFQLLGLFQQMLKGCPETNFRPSFTPAGLFSNC